MEKTDFEGQSMRRTMAVLATWSLILCSCSDKDVEQISRVSTKAWGRARSTVDSAQAKPGPRSGPATSEYVPMGEDVVQRVEAKLNGDSALKGAQINVARASNGLVLSGSVSSAYQYRRAGELARSVAGRQIQNNVVIRGPSK